MVLLWTVVSAIVLGTTSVAADTLGRAVDLPTQTSASISVAVRSLKVFAASPARPPVPGGPPSARNPPWAAAAGTQSGGQGRSQASSVSTTSGALPANWNLPEFDDRSAPGWVVAPGLVVPWRDGERALAALSPTSPTSPTSLSSPSSLSSSVTAVTIPATDGSLHFRMRFDVPDGQAAQSVELSVLYRDGFVAFLNGVEVARRNLPTGMVSDAGQPRPRIPHGGEPEHIYLPAFGAAWRLKRTDNLLAVRIAPALTRGVMDPIAPAGQIALAVFSRVRLVRGPYLLAPTDDAISVAWETDLPARGTLFFERLLADGAHDKFSMHVSKAPLLQCRQVVPLTGLEPGQRYRYRVEVAPPELPRRTAEPRRGTIVVRSPDAEFDAAPVKQGIARFVVYGDMRAPGHAAHAEIVAAIVRERPALVLNSGDLVATGSEESAWQRYFEITAPMGSMAAVVPALGNHEAYLKGAAKSWSLFGLPSASPVPGTSYTSLDWGGIHFVVLDTNNIDAAQRDWLVRDLSAARRGPARAIIVLCHDPPWSHGTHGGSPVMEREIAPLLVAGGVDVLFAGHDHLYERGTGIVGGRPRLPYVISGGGGAPLYNPSCIPVTESGSKLGAGPGEGAWPGGLPACPAFVATIKKAHHYVVVEVDATRIRMCPRAPDGVALEPCVSIALAANRKE